MHFDQQNSTTKSIVISFFRETYPDTQTDNTHRHEHRHIHRCPEHTQRVMGEAHDNSRSHSDARTPEQTPPGALHTRCLTPADITAIAQNSWLCSLVSIPFGWNQWGLAWPGELSWTRQGRAGPARAKPQMGSGVSPHPTGSSLSPE